MVFEWITFCYFCFFCSFLDDVFTKSPVWLINVLPSQDYDSVQIKDFWPSDLHKWICPERRDDLSSLMSWFIYNFQYLVRISVSTANCGIYVVCYHWYLPMILVLTLTAQYSFYNFSCPYSLLVVHFTSWGSQKVPFVSDSSHQEWLIKLWPICALPMIHDYFVLGSAVWTFCHQFFASPRYYRNLT